MRVIAVVLALSIVVALGAAIPMPAVSAEEESAAAEVLPWAPESPSPPPLPSSDSDVVDMDTDTETGVDIATEFEISASGKPRAVGVKPVDKNKRNNPKLKPHSVPVSKLSRAEQAQRQLNDFKKDFEKVDERTDKPRFVATVSSTVTESASATASTAETEAMAEIAAQAHADLASALEMKVEAATAIATTSEAEMEAEMEIGMEVDMSETSPAAKKNENYACYRWSRPPRTPAKSLQFAPREGHASWLSRNGKSLYVFGGCDRQTLPKNCYGELKQMDVQTRVWRNRKILGVIDDGKTDHSLHMQGAAYATDPKSGRRLFVFGGLRVDSVGDSKFSNSLDLLFYDKRQNQWSWTHVKTTGDHPPPSQDATIILVGNELVLFGGYSDVGFFNDVYTIRTSPKNVLVDEKDPDLWKWKKHKPSGNITPPGRRGHTMTLQAYRGNYRALIFGGLAGTAAFSDMWVLNIPNWIAKPTKPKSGKIEKGSKGLEWIKVVAGSAAAQSVPTARAFHSANVVRPHHLVIFGGCDQFTRHCFEDVLLFNTRTMTWLPTPPSLVQSTFAPVLRAGAKKAAAKAAAKQKDGKAPNPPKAPPAPKKRYPPWNPSARKKLTTTLLRNGTRVMVVGGCDFTTCFGDVYEMDLKGVCIDSCGDHGRFIDYRRLPLPKKWGAKKSFIELAADHTLAQAQAAFAAQFEADSTGDSDASEQETEGSEEEAEEVDENMNHMLEEIELTAEQALESTRVDSADDDTIDHPDTDYALLEVSSDPSMVGPNGVPLPATGTDGKPLPPFDPSVKVDPENKPPSKMKLIRKKGSRRRTKQRKEPFGISNLLPRMSVDTLKELNKERSYDAKCTCRDGYMGKFCQTKSKCYKQCSGQKQGLCITEGIHSYCVCAPGFWGIGCEFKTCQSNCSSHGICTPQQIGNNTQTVCKCEAGFWGRDCSLAEEWVKDKLQQQNCALHCSGQGRCTNNYTLPLTKAGSTPGNPIFKSTNEFNLHPLNRPFDPLMVDPSKIKDPKKRAAVERRQAEARKKADDEAKKQPYRCKCRAGYGGDDCRYQCPLLCSRHGSCNATGQCVCNDGWTGPGCDTPTCGLPDAAGNHADACTYHGTCDKAKGRCKCNKPFAGNSCSLDLSCNGHGTWVKGTKGRRGKCKCNPGWFLDDCSVKLECPHDCSSHGRCILKKKKLARTFKPLSSTLIPPVQKGEPAPPAPPPRVVPGMCVCAKGFHGADCASKVCPKMCNRNGDCKDGTCVCYPGFTGTDCGNRLNCPSNCTDSRHGACVQVRSRKTKAVYTKCRCLPGWAGADCSQLACPKDCSRRGKCMAGQCRCDEGRFGADCSISCPKDCSAHGQCQSTGQCACDAEYTGSDCATRKTCPTANNQECAGHGLCHVPSAKCFCEPGYSGKACQKDSTSCKKLDCSGRGTCSFGKCFCQIGFSGTNCELSTTCKQECNKRGVCNNGQCQCNPGWSGDACQTQIWDNSCPGNCNNHGLCQQGVCSCTQGWSGSDCSQEVGFCKDNTCSGNGYCAYDKCHCLPGTSGDKCQHGQTCPTGCQAKQGMCLNGKCMCLPGFAGESCSEPLVCPGATSIGTCSGHGVCLQGRCACEPGYGGEDCSTLLVQSAACPKACSGAGVCHMGKCFCAPGYGGYDCSMAHETKCPNDCSGHAPKFNQRGVCHLGVCLCHPGYSGASCETEISCPPSCSKNGVCAHGKCFCVAGWTGPACEHPLKGPLKHRTYMQEMKEVAARGGCGGCSMHGMCVGDKCVCEAGYGGPQCADVAGGALVARCPNNCNGQGMCLFGKCYCSPGWGGVGCDKPVELSCPNDCSQKGICRYGRCFCNPGVAGEDCSKAAKCDAKCGSHGVCLDGRCVCAEGFTGEACNIAAARNPRKPRSTPSFIERDAASNEESDTDSDEEGTHSFSEIGAGAHALNVAAAGSSASSSTNAKSTNNAGTVAGINAVGLHSDVASAQPAAIVTTYTFPIGVVAAVAFLVGVAVSAFAKALLEKRAQMQRQEQLIRPLLVQQQ